MRFRPAVVVALLALVVSGAVVAAGAPGSGDFGGAADATGAVDRGAAVDGVGSATGAPNETVNGTSTEGFERADPGLVITVQLRANGDARWRITHRYVVNGSNETRAFESFADEVSAGERDVGVTRDAFVEFASAASEATGRKMEVRDAGWAGSTVENGTGEVTYAFTWTNFGEVEGDQVVVEDAFRSPDGTWFPRLYEGQRLVIRPPEGLNIVQTPTDKGLNQRALVWDGYREFEPGYLSVVLERPDPPTTSTTNTTTDPGEGDGPPLSPFLLGVGFALLLVFVGAGSYLFARWQTVADDDDGDATPGAVTEASDGGSPPASAAGDEDGSATAAGATAGAAADPAGDAAEDGAAAGAAGGAVASAADDDDGDDEEVDETLLSDEERVLRLLDENGGRMKQANIVTETGWSNAKVSQLLSGMDDDDEIQKLRIGRENLITLPDENVADFGDDE